MMVMSIIMNDYDGGDDDDFNHCDDDDDDDQPQSSLIGGLSSEVCTRSSIRQAPILITLATSN